MVRSLFAVAAFAAVAAASPALASDASVRTFIRDGAVYSYQTVQKDGRTVLQGVGDNRSMRLEVRGNKVSGTVDGVAVSFIMPEAQMAADSAQ